MTKKTKNKEIFEAIARPSQLVEFKIDDDESNKIGCVLAVTFDGCDQIFYTIQDMDSLEDGSCYIYESVDEKDIVRVLPENEDCEEAIQKLMGKKEIKFRAWDKNTNKMLYIGDNQWTETIGKMLDSFEDEDLMQSTGLKDKNGKEIYKRDIICWDFDSKQKNEIVFQEGCLGHINLMGINKEYREFVPINKSRAEHMIVCGNIHENPDLLKLNFTLL